MFWYLAETLELDITFASNAIDKQVGYINSDLTGLKDERKSIDKYTFLLFWEPVSHQSKQQGTVAFFSTGVEYLATKEAGKEVL